MNGLREIFLDNLAIWIPRDEKRAESLRKAVQSGDASVKKELQRVEKHIEWMKEQIIFTQERMAMSTVK